MDYPQILRRREKHYSPGSLWRIVSSMSNEPISIVMPCFNEADTLQDVLDELDGALQRAGVAFEVIAINDGSTDGTADVLARSAVPDKVIEHRFNRGYGASLKDGIRAASHEVVLIMDSDGQHPPENILVLLEAFDGYDMVIGARTRQASHYWRKPGKILLKAICQFLVGQKIPDINSGFRLARRSELLKYLHLCSDAFSFSTSSTLAFLSDRLAVKFVPIDIRARQGGTSQVRVKTGFSALMLILRIIGTFNPLQIFIPPTIVLFVVGLVYMAWGVFFKQNVGDLAVLFLIMSVLLFCFGLLADQLALLRREINKNQS